jgi:hypothetical protein
VQAARAAAAPAGSQQQAEAFLQRLEARLKEREGYAAQLEGRLAESEKHKQTLREAVEVGVQRWWCCVEAGNVLSLWMCPVLRMIVVSSGFSGGCFCVLVLRTGGIKVSIHVAWRELPSLCL